MLHWPGPVLAKHSKQRKRRGSAKHDERPRRMMTARDITPLLRLRRPPQSCIVVMTLAVIMRRGRSSCSLTCYLLRNCTDFLACAFEAVFLNGVAQPTNRGAIVDLFTGVYQ